MKRRQSKQSAKAETSAKEPKWLMLLTLSIAIVGGIPGLISVKDYFGRTSLKLDFDRSRSIACAVQSENPYESGKLAIVLLRVSVTGGGTTPVFVQGLKLEARMGGQWFSGRHVIPQYFNYTNEMGFSERGVHMGMKREPHYKMTGFFSKWEELGANTEPLEYGQPREFSYAAVFGAKPEAFEKCDMLRITVQDFLGHEQSLDFVPTPSMKENANVAFLVLDGPVSSKPPLIFIGETNGISVTPKK